MPGRNRFPQFAIRLDDDDAALLKASAKLEKLSRAEILRRALRRYAQQLGVRPPAGQQRGDHVTK